MGVEDKQKKPSESVNPQDSAQDLQRDIYERSEEEQQLIQLSVERAGEAVFWMGPDAHFLYVNEAACRSLGYSRTELLSMTVHDVDPQFPKTAWPEHWQDVKDRGNFSFESQHRTQAGKIFPVEVSVNYLTFKGKEFNVAIVRDISARKQVEEIQKSIYKISEAAQSSESLQELYRSIHEIITELMPAKNNFYIALLDKEANMLSFPYYVDEFDESPEPYPLGKGFTEYVLRTQKPLLVTPELSKQLKDAGEVVTVGTPSVNWLGVPLKSNQETIGVLVVQSYDKAQQYTEEEKNILMFVSNQIAMAITRRQAEDSLRRSEEWYRSVVESSLNAIIITDEKIRAIYVNNQLLEIMGYSQEEVLGKDFLTFLDEESRSLIRKRMELRRKGKKIPSNYEIKVIRKDGEKRNIEVSATVIPDSEGRFMLLGQGLDITERKRNEQKIQTSLKEKELLLREIHHRVKNNLQIISSLLNLQTYYLKDEQAKELFEESRYRVQSMAMIHEKLYGAKNLSKVNFKEYIESLSRFLFQMYGVDPGRIELNIDVRYIFLDINTAIPCGLLICELISNALKYAFPNDRQGQILVNMRPQKVGKFTLTVSDNGVGLKKGIKLKGAESFGLQLVDMLTEQLQGKIHIKRANGTTFTITFKELKYPRKV